MTPKERAAMQQALEALRNVGNALMVIAAGRNLRQLYGEMRDDAVNGANKAITALREALAEQVEQEPVGYWQGTFNTEGGAILYEVPQVSAFGYCYPNYPVYAYPVRTKDLTDVEVEKVWRKHGGYMVMPIDFARAVIAADRELNK